MNKHKTNPLVTAIGSAFVAATALSAVALSSSTFAAENPFQADQLRSGYNLAAGHAEGKCGEGKCGESKAKAHSEGKCGEGKCGEGKCGGDMKKSAEKAKEGCLVYVEVEAKADLSCIPANWLETKRKDGKEFSFMLFEVE